MYLLKLDLSAFMVAVFVVTVTGQKGKKNHNRICQFHVPSVLGDRHANDVLKLQYDNRHFDCVNCSTPDNSVTTLIPRIHGHFFRLGRFCRLNCNGAVCSDKPNSTCYYAEKVAVSYELRTVNKCAPDDEDEIPSDEDINKTKNQIPLIIGFAVGGVMLIVVIAGVILGRSNRNLPPGDSDVATTPVSMSYSEWLSNYSTGGGRGSKIADLRVQETVSINSEDVYPAMDVYNIVYDANNMKSYQNGSTVIEIDETGGMENAFQEFPVEFFTDSLQGSLAFPEEEIPQEYGNDRPDSSVIIVGEKEELNNNNKGFKPRETFFCSTNYDVWPERENSLHFGKHSLTRSDKRRSFGQWSDESEFDIHYLRKRDQSLRSGRPSISSHWTSWSSIKSSCLSKRLRLNFANLTHVFVDVHRNMTYSCDDVRSVDHESMIYRRNSEFLKSRSSIRSIYTPNPFLVIEENFSFDRNRKLSYDAVLGLRHNRRIRRYSL